MTASSSRSKWQVFAAVSLIFFFLNGATFTSLGVVLYTMVAELHWSQAAAGFSFTLLGIACGVCSPLPAMMMSRFGGRWTIVAGAATLCLGFFLAAVSAGIWAFYVAMMLLGLGYALGGNVPAIYLLAAWFPDRQARVIGLYLMIGAFGATVGPPVVEAIVSHAGSWRAHWRVMGWCALVVGAVCFAFVRDIAAPAARGARDDAPPAGETKTPGWSPREAIFTRQFTLVAAAMTMTMACITTNSSVTISHLVKMGATPAFGAVILSILALVATITKGVAGRLCELMPVPKLLAGGLIVQAAGNLLIARADTPALQYGAALVYGAGWGASYVAGNVALLRWFGGNVGSRILSVVWMITTLAAAGPLVAGLLADDYGSFSPIFYVYAVLLVIVAVPTMLLGAPVRQGRAAAADEPATGRIGDDDAQPSSV
jgi:MFS family permease